MSKLTKEQTAEHTKKQIDEMLIDLKELLYKKVDIAVNSGSVPDSFYTENALLAKAVFDSVMLDRPYKALSSYEKDFKNIHLCI